MVIIDIDDLKEQTIAQKEKNLQNKELNQIQYKFIHDKSVKYLQEIFETRFDSKLIKKYKKKSSSDKG